jgi:hypothetical protein
MPKHTVRRQRPHQRPNALLFRMAFARARPCYCYGCIVLTAQERAYERRVFRLARAWAKLLREQPQCTASGNS